MSNTKTSLFKTFVAFILSAALVSTAAWVILNRQFIQDQITVWSYQPSERISSIENRVNFTEKGKFVFYATEPLVESQASFNNKCPRQETSSPILGCYTPSDNIHIYDITNQQLDGMEEITAAHEMLHAVWYRTSTAEKEKLANELKSAYSKIDNAELKKRMAYYERTEPTEYVNELHSILGTEISPLSQYLEDYYSQYFERDTVLALHQQYSAIYNQLFSRADELYAKMESLGNTIKTASDSYDTQANQLSSEIESFNARASSGVFTSMSQFNSERRQLTARSDALEAARLELNANINTYNGYYNEYQEISKQIEVLNNSVDSFKQVDQAPSV